MIILQYDGSLEGFFSAVFEVFEYKYNDCEIIAEGKNIDYLFGEIHHTISDENKAQRVLKRLKKQTGSEGIRTLIYSFLSEYETREKRLLEVVRYAVKNAEKNIFEDFSHESVLQLKKWERSVGREKHRMEAFVRFEAMQDGIFVAKIEPDFNVLPLIIPHFKSRFQDQQWIIYDVKRNFGYYYNLEKVEEIVLENPDILLQTKSNWVSEEETSYQKLWQRYFTKTTINERKNLKLHTQWVPKRYWKYLTEKNM